MKDSSKLLWIAYISLVGEILNASLLARSMKERLQLENWLHLNRSGSVVKCHPEWCNFYQRLSHRTKQGKIFFNKNSQKYNPVCNEEDHSWHTAEDHVEGDEEECTHPARHSGVTNIRHRPLVSEGTELCILIYTHYAHSCDYSSNGEKVKSLGFCSPAKL